MAQILSDIKISPPTLDLSKQILPGHPVRAITLGNPKRVGTSIAIPQFTIGDNDEPAEEEEAKPSAGFSEADDLELPEELRDPVALEIHIAELNLDRRRYKPSIYEDVAVNKILVVHFASAPGIGDQLIPLGIIELLKERFPSASLDVVSQYPKLLNGKGVGIVEPELIAGKVLHGQHKQRAVDIPKLQTLMTSGTGGGGYDLVIDLDYAFDDRYKGIDIPLLVNRTVDDYDFRLKREDGDWTPLGTTLAVNMYERYRLLFDLLELNPRDTAFPTVQISTGSRKIGGEVLLNLGIDSGEKMILLNPATFSPVKEWAHESWCTFLRSSVNELRSRGIDLGAYRFIVSPGTEKRHAKTAKRMFKCLESELSESDSTPKLLPKMTFDEFSGVLAHMSGVVTMDTGVAHLTPALGIPCYTIFTHLDPSVWKHPNAITTLCPDQWITQKAPELNEGMMQLLELRE